MSAAGAQEAHRRKLSVRPPWVVGRALTCDFVQAGEPTYLLEGCAERLKLHDLTRTADHATLVGMEYIAPSLPIIITVCLTTVGIILTVVLLNNGTNGKIDGLRKEVHDNEIQIAKVQEHLSQMRKDISNLLARVMHLEESVTKLKSGSAL